MTHFGSCNIHQNFLEGWYGQIRLMNMASDTIGSAVEQQRDLYSIQAMEEEGHGAAISHT